MDGALNMTSHVDGVGIVVRNECDQFICGKTLSFDQVSSPAHIEALDGKVVYNLVLEHRFSPTRLESCTLLLVQVIHSIHDFVVLLRVIYEDVMHLFAQLSGFNFTHHYRDENYVADSLARWALNCKPCDVFFTSTPPFLEDIITKDCI
ncbi:hypothetical protein ACLB2K_062978 [Fragaria x ananassa]